jgi:hypothetical protein
MLIAALQLTDAKQSSSLRRQLQRLVSARFSQIRHARLIDQLSEDAMTTLLATLLDVPEVRFVFDIIYS